MRAVKEPDLDIDELAAALQAALPPLLDVRVADFGRRLR
jgi:hypothetical protein